MPDYASGLMPITMRAIVGLLGGLRASLLRIRSRPSPALRIPIRVSVCPSVQCSLSVIKHGPARMDVQMISTIHMGYSLDDTRITFRASALPLVYCSPPDLPGLAGLIMTRSFLAGCLTPFVLAETARQEHIPYRVRPICIRLTWHGLQCNPNHQEKQTTPIVHSHPIVQAARDLTNMI